MNSRVTIIVVILAVIAAGIAGADYVLKEHPQEIALRRQTASGAVMSSASSSSEQQTVVTTGSGASSQSGMSSSTHAVKKGVSTKKKSGADVSAVLASLQLIPTATSEQSLLGLSHASGSLTMVLLSNNDRAALFAWIENDDVKTVFSSLKQALQEQFSPKLKDLTDETRTSDTGPPVDVLSFSDPAISPEKVVFLRVRTRLYEFHVATKAEETINRLIGELSK